MDMSQLLPRPAGRLLAFALGAASLIPSALAQANGNFVTQGPENGKISLVSPSMTIEQHPLASGRLQTTLTVAGQGICVTDGRDASVLGHDGKRPALNVRAMDPVVDAMQFYGQDALAGHSDSKTAVATAIQLAKATEGCTIVPPQLQIDQIGQLPSLGGNQPQTVKQSSALETMGQKRYDDGSLLVSFRNPETDVKFDRNPTPGDGRGADMITMGVYNKTGDGKTVYTFDGSSVLRHTETQDGPGTDAKPCPQLLDKMKNLRSALLGDHLDTGSVPAPVQDAVNAIVHPATVAARPASAPPIKLAAN